jgi:hypothetical protein
VLWCAGVLFTSLPAMNIAWSPVVHVKFSNDETIDYPAAWGLDRIRAAAEKRADDIHKRELELVASMPQSRKTECEAIRSNTPAPSMPKDCERFLDPWLKFSVDLPKHSWEGPDIFSPPLPITRAIA